MFARALEDESRAWNRDDRRRVLRERVDPLFVCERDSILLYCKKILRVIQDLKWAEARMDGRRSKQNVVPESHFMRLECRPKNVISSDQYGTATSSMAYWHIFSRQIYYLSRTLFGANITSKQHRRCSAPLQFKYAEDSNIYHCNTLRISSRFRGNAIRIVIQYDRILMS